MPNNNLGLKFNKILIGFLVSHLLVLAIPVLSIIIIIVPRFISLLENELKQSTYNTMSSARQTLDIRLRELDELSFQISQNRYVNELYYERNSKSTDVILSMNYLIQDMASLSATNKFISAIYVYFDNMDALVSANTKFDSEYFYSSVVNYDAMTREKWVEKIRNVRVSSQVWPLMQIRGEKGGFGALTYANSIPVSTTERMGTVFAIIDEAQIKKLFLNGKFNDGTKFYIVDNEKNIVFSSDNKNIHLSDLMINNSNESFFEYKLDGRDYLSLVLDSNTSNFKYVCLVPADVVLNKVDNIKLVISIVLVLSLLIGVFAAYLLSIREYKPIKNISDRLSRLKKNHDTNSTNEKVSDYHSIYNSIEEVFSEKKTLEKSVKNYLPTARLNIISGMIAGKYEDNQEVCDQLEMLGIKLYSHRFNVTVLHIEECSEFIQEDLKNNKKAGTSFGLAKFIVSNVVEEIVDRNFICFTLEDSNHVILLINYREDEDENESLSQLEKMLEEASSFLKSHAKLIISIGIGNIYHGVENISQSSREAVAALNYRIIYGKNSITFYKDIKVDSDAYYYPNEVENRIMNLTKSGDYRGAEECLNTVFEENFKKRNLPIKLIHCVAFDIIGTILKIFYEMNIHYSDLLGDEIDIHTRLLDCTTVDEMQKEISGLLLAACKYIKDIRENNNIEMRSNIIDYVNTNYADCNLSLAVITDEFNLSSSYIIKVFKELTGYSFGDYLTRVRINKAKDLLASTDLNINEISEKVGYNIVNSFIRSFKKYESITPGQFKEQCRNQAQG